MQEETRDRSAVYVRGARSAHDRCDRDIILTGSSEGCTPTPNSMSFPSVLLTKIRRSRPIGTRAQW